MKVCDKHRDIEAIDTLIVEGEGTRIDLCDECKYAVLGYLNGAVRDFPKDKETFRQTAQKALQKVLGQ